jgi:hypothetical protein
MPQYNDFKCPACNLYFSTDLDRDELQLCPLCGHHSPVPVKIVEAKSVSLCAECRDHAAKKRDAELEREIEDAFTQAGF